MATIERFEDIKGWQKARELVKAIYCLTAERLYRLLEEQVVPLYYSRDERDIPAGWVQKMKHALRVAGEQFTARRMVQQYVTQYYAPAMCGNSVPDDPPVA